MKRLITAILVLGLLSCKNEPKKESDTFETADHSMYLDSLNLVLDELSQLDRINGYGVAIVDANGSVYHREFGYMDVDQKREYSEQTLQNIGSISKTFIGISLMKAQEMGMLNLDDPINDYLPFEVTNPNFPDEAITIRQLANHTSGIQDTDAYNQQSYILKEMVADSLLSSVEETLNPPEAMIPFLDFLPEVLVPGGEYYSKEVFINSVPGTRFEYTNIGATLAALVLEKAAEVPFDEFTQEHILDPLGMDASGWNFDSIEMDNHSKLYADKNTEIPFYELITYPDGGMRSSTHDMSIYLSELINAFNGKGTLLKAESYKELFAPSLDDSHFEERDAEFPYNDEYNMGVFMGHSGTGLVGHTGGDPGTIAFMFFNPETDMGQYMIINTGIVDDEGIQQALGSMQAVEEAASNRAR